MELTRIRLTDLELNRGQVEGLPSNPREWTRGDLDKLKKSIEETPELLEARGLIVWPHNGKYVIMGGNMRFSALREMNAKDAPCYVLPEDTSIEKLKEIVIKDNGVFGAWDMDMIANEWDSLPIVDWGMPQAVDVEKEIEKIKKDEERIGRVPFTKILGEEHNYVVLYFDNDVDWLQAQTLFELEPVKAMPTKRGEQSLGMTRIGVGRVLEGAKAIERILSYRENHEN